MQTVRDSLNQALDQMQNAGNIPPEAVAMVRQQFESGLSIAEGIMGLPTTLPRPVGRFLEALGLSLIHISEPTRPY